MISSLVARELGGKPLSKERTGRGFCWVWGDFRSQGFEDLEERPWTPAVIGGKLCFSAREKGKWRVVWGGRAGRLYDDAYDTTEFEGKPLYVAWEGRECFLVLDDQESQPFAFQVAYQVENGKLWVVRWKPYGERFEPEWGSRNRG